MMKLGITDAVKHLIIINVIVFIGMMTIGTNGDVFFRWFALYFPDNELFKPWQVVTHMFMHSSQQFGHILFNMLGLWMFGTAVEQQLGSKKFVFIYFSTGFGAAALQLAFSYFQFNSGLQTLIESGVNKLDIMNTLNEGSYYEQWKIILGKDFENFIGIYIAPMVGASGCIMGVLAAFGVMNPNAELMLIFLPIPIKAKYFIPGIILLDIISALTGQSFFSPSNTAYAAHIGGALIGFIIMWYWKKNSMNKYRWDR